VSCKKCENGWVQADAVPVLCRCQAVSEPVQEYVNRIAVVMGLAHWKIEVQATPSDEGNLAEVDCVYGQCYARLFVCEQWHGLPPEIQRSTLAHELMHVHTAMIISMLHDQLDAVVSKKERRLVEAAIRLCEEHMVDAVALAWADALPLPKVGK
jgi:hypothetical protein